MWLPEKLYAILSGDRGRFPLQPIWRRTTAAGAAVSVTAAFTNDFDGRILLLFNAVAYATSGAAQTSTFQRIYIQSPALDASAVVTFLAANIVAPGDVYAIGSVNWSGGVLIPPLWRVSGDSTFSAGVAANTVSLDLHGVLIPRGTFNV